MSFPKPTNNYAKETVSFRNKTKVWNFKNGQLNNTSKSIEKNAEGRDYQAAKERAQNINYNYALVSNELQLDSYLTTGFKNKFRDQQVEVILYLPEEMIVKFNKNTKSFLSYNWSNNSIVSYNEADHFLKIVSDDVECLDCPVGIDVDIHDDEDGIKINEDGVEIKVDSNIVSINKKGIKANSSEVKVKIDNNGIQIKSDNN